MAVIGDLSETEAAIKTEWKIRDFSSLPQEENLKFKSYKFHFSGSLWEITMYPFGNHLQPPNMCISLYLGKTSVGFHGTVDFSIGFKKADGKIDLERKDTKLFKENECDYGWSKFIKRSVIIERRSEFIPSDIMTVICCIKNSKETSITGSLCNRLLVSDNLKEIYLKGKKTDLLLQLSDGNVSAHQLILETRSSLFASLINQVKKESDKAIISIDDVDLKTMHILLLYIYSGASEYVSQENAFSLYAAAKKFDIKGFKEICSEFIIRNISVEWVCDVIKFAEFHKDQEVSRYAKKYFEANARQILKSEKWKNFAKENHDISVELLSTAFTALMPE